MRRSLAAWYYLLLVVIVVGGFILADFSRLAPSVRWLLIIFLGLALVGPLFARRSPSAHRPFAGVPTPDQAVELGLLKNINQELAEKLTQLKARGEELTVANERLKELDKQKSQFVSMTTHQLRTPLSAIKWTFHMILGGELGPVTEDQKHFLRKGYDAAERVITVINDWLNLDYIEANRDEYKLVPVNPNELVDGVVFEFSDRLKAKQLNLTVERPQINLPPLRLDPIKISMVLENLIDNAIKYTLSGGQITIKINDDRVNTAERVLEISVSDTGIGIPAAERDRLFTRFFRSTNALKLAPRGSGLGLFIVKDIVERHGGKIWFESEEGRGSTFHFTLPFQTA